MSTGSMFDILMEIRKVDKQISESKSKLQKSRQEFINLETRLNHTKELQSKATKVYYELQKKAEITESEMEDAHKNYHGVLELVREHVEFEDGSEKEEVLLKINELKKKRDLLKQKVDTIKRKEENLLSNITDIQVQINIQKKKNVATHIRLQKCLQELKQDEKKLEDELKALILK